MVISKRLLHLPELHTFYMQHGESDDAFDIMVALRPETNAWLKRDESSNAL
jgi:hypothetical protein